jgi:hypothetical protein
MPEGRYIPERDWPDWALLLQEFRAVGKTLRRPPPPPGRGGRGRKGVRFCKPDANIAAGATGTVSIWSAGPASSGAVDTGRNDSGHAPIAVEALQWCVIETIAGDKYVLPFKCSV